MNPSLERRKNDEPERDDPKGFELYRSLVPAAVTVALTLYVPILTGQAIDCIIAPGAVDFAAIRHILWKIGGAVAVTMAAQWIMNVCNNKITLNPPPRIPEDTGAALKVY